MHPSAAATTSHSGMRREDSSTSSADQHIPNYLVFAANRPRAPLLVPAALRPEGSTVQRARSQPSSRRNSSASPSPSPCPPSATLLPHRTGSDGATTEAAGLDHPRSSSAAPVSRISSSQCLHKRSPPGESRTTLPGQNTPVLPPNAVHSSASKWLQSVPCASPALQSNAFPQQHASSSTAASPSSTAPDLSYSFDSLPSSSSKTVNSVGQMLPRSSWIPDAEAQKCQYSDCSATFPPANTASAAYFFGLTNIISHPFQSRRHHCRACGKIFCSLHSSNTLPLSTELATSTDGLHMQPPPTTPGLASPVGGAFPFSMLHRSSGSGSTTPLDAPAQYSQDAIQKTPQLSLSTVAARVCDDCFTSLQLAANLAGLATFNTVSSPSLSSSGSVGSTFQPRSHSPVQPKFSTCSQASSASSRTQASGAQKPQKPGSTAASDPMQQRNGQATQRRNMQPLAAMHPLDPRHSLLDLAHKEESAGGSNPDGSLAASLGTTPAIGWTWST